MASLEKYYAQQLSAAWLSRLGSATNLVARGTDERAPNIREVPFGLMSNILLSRAIGFSLIVLKHLSETFKIDVPGAMVDELLITYATIQDRDAQEQAARSIMLCCAMESIRVISQSAGQRFKSARRIHEKPITTRFFAFTPGCAE